MAIVASLVEHRKNVNLCQVACLALAHISALYNGAGAAACAASGAVGAIIAASVAHANNVDVCVAAARALRNISCFAPGAAACHAGGARACLVAIYTRHEPARINAKFALERLGFDVTTL